jgi:hypothetical protein
MVAVCCRFDLARLATIIVYAFDTTILYTFVDKHTFSFNGEGKQ